ncbi:hypothetical protein RKD49_007829 [Streptomyces glaucescens]
MRAVRAQRRAARVEAGTTLARARPPDAAAGHPCHRHLPGYRRTVHGQRHREVVQRRENGYRELVDGETVTVDVTQGQKGPQAENIVRG